MESDVKGVFSPCEDQGTTIRLEIRVRARLPCHWTPESVWVCSEDEVRVASLFALPFSWLDPDELELFSPITNCLDLKEKKNFNFLKGHFRFLFVLLIPSWKRLKKSNKKVSHAPIVFPVCIFVFRFPNDFSCMRCSSAQWAKNAHWNRILILIQVPRSHDFLLMFHVPRCSTMSEEITLCELK